MEKVIFAGKGVQAFTVCLGWAPGFMALVYKWARPNIPSTEAPTTNLKFRAWFGGPTKENRHPDLPPHFDTGYTIEFEAPSIEAIKYMSLLNGIVCYSDFTHSNGYWFCLPKKAMCQMYIEKI